MTINNLRSDSTIHLLSQVLIVTLLKHLSYKSYISAEASLEILDSADTNCSCGQNSGYEVKAGKKQQKEQLQT